MYSGSILSVSRAWRYFTLSAAALLSMSFPIKAQWVTAYYINTSIYVNDIPWSKATHVVDLGVSPSSSSGNIAGIAGSDADAFTAAAHANGKKALLCVRDADGNIGLFGSAITNNLSGFVGNIVSFVNAHNYDGVDLDWEAGNFNGPDAANYTNFIAALRSALGSGKLITMAAYWNYGLANVVQNSSSRLNQVNVMCYDMDQWNSDVYYNLATTLAAGDTTHNSCATQAANFAGYIPAAKIGLGIPFYGRVWTGCADSACSDGLHNLLQTWSSQNNNPIAYRDLVASSYWSQPHQWDATRGASYISINGSGSSGDRFISYTDSQQINSMVQLMRSGGYGGIMEYEVDYDFMSNQTGDARHPLATAAWAAVFGSTSTPSTPSTPTVSAPVVSSGSPSGTLPATTTQATMTVATNENATCKYATTAGTAYSSMPSTFSTTGGTAHSTALSGLASGRTYTYYIRCASSGVADTTDYQVSFATAAPPTISSGVTLTPSSGSGYSQNFTAQVIDANGASALTQVDLIIGSVGTTNSCWAEYAPATRTIYLRDNNNNWMPAALGSSTVLQNSQCSLNAGSSSAATSGAGTQLNVNFAMSFTSSYVGAQPLVTFVADSSNWLTGFVTEGTYNVTAPPVVAGLSLSLSPASGAGSSAKFVMKATDSGGFASVQQLNLFIGSNLGDANQCYMDYEASSRTLYLMSSDNSHWMPGTVGSQTTLINNQCAIHLSQVLVVGSGNTLTVTIPVALNPSTFRGAKSVLTFGADAAGQVSGWRQAGTWTVQ